MSKELIDRIQELLLENASLKEDLRDDAMERVGLKNELNTSCKRSQYWQNCFNDLASRIESIREVLDED